ncbi:DNA-directed RNA polymerase III subunit RPC1-like [Drosophila miranda]|uniref:DNA-directed RNA polymerase III subunit RPC1-like n=1 Tax=Drosophila miranda TaxID=7229 RepID=UPI00143F9CBF|nr:DNA-directed RNA polymerase III subunit RPC1-like [Drosophila miranda]XP_033242788.1 DNA-directed RNA polymerase III subunit RPC1-like [Drosophila miranda]XP_033242963.1 DNA-directed RNA polymerase III subunit RPC1-like [Drosophila miranda]XP_033242964.1 DNA-directed RNA polymerase III subunit RPC1-like [Drosophila miranda]
MADEIQQEALVRITSKNLYQGQRQPVPSGVLDRRMGISTKDAVCETCGHGLIECIGHFGYLDLALPVFHIGHFRATINILQMICKSCAQVMLKFEDRLSFDKKLHNPNFSYLGKKALHAQMLAKAKKVTKCPHCGTANGGVKKGPGLLKILHDPYKGRKVDAVFTSNMDEMLRSTEFNRDLNLTLSNYSTAEELTPLMVLDLFEQIPQSDVALLGMCSRGAHPKHLIVTRVFVPPACIRPSVLSEVKAGTTEDDLTMKQSEILLINDVIQRHMATGGKIELIYEDWDFLQLHVALYFHRAIACGFESPRSFSFLNGILTIHLPFSSLLVVSKKCFSQTSSTSFFSLSNFQNRSEFPTSIVVATINLSPFDLVQPDIIHPNSVFRPSSPFILTTPSFKICVHIYPNYYIYPTWIVKVRVCQHIILPLSFVNIEWLYR